MTKDNQAEASAPSLPLFYRDPVPLSFEEHRDVGVAPATNLGFARNAVAIPLCVGEFVLAMRHYPIVFAMDDNASPIGLVGIKRGQNLFVEEAFRLCSISMRSAQTNERCSHDE